MGLTYAGLCFIVRVASHFPCRDFSSELPRRECEIARPSESKAVLFISIWQAQQSNCTEIKTRIKLRHFFFISLPIMIFPDPAFGGSCPMTSRVQGTGAARIWGSQRLEVARSLGVASFAPASHNDFFIQMMSQI